MLCRYAVPTARRPWPKGCSRTGVGRDRSGPRNIKADLKMFMDVVYGIFWKAIT